MLLRRQTQRNQTESATQTPGLMADFHVGIDVGSTTVKTVVRANSSGDLLCHLYVRHESRQAETVLDGLRQVEREFGVAAGNARVFVTGSGGHRIAGLLRARFIQEVTAVSSAVERWHPEVRSVIEIGGQDSKVIVFRDTSIAGRKKKIATMNDKCAGGTGAVIEKIAAKLGIDSEALARQEYDGVTLHPVAGKCGVFAETDITGLQKQGVPPGELLASLFDAIAVQNLTVLTRGQMLLPQVLLLGGPNALLPGMQQAWRQHMMHLWERHGVPVPEKRSPEELVMVPPLAQFFGAMGAIEFGDAEGQQAGWYRGYSGLEDAIHKSERTGKSEDSAPGLCTDALELQEFSRRYSLPAPHTPAAGSKGKVQGYLGIDGGSTSTKAVFLSESGAVLQSAYRLSQADPITDAIAVVSELRERIAELGMEMDLRGVGTTGYSKDLLKKVLQADVALVETVAHANSALHYYRDVDAIIDVGGQDIKILRLREGAVQDFRLNTQCSAGNGYFLQATAQALGIKIDEFADMAFRARHMPLFSYGCAIFLQSDIVNFQRHGWKPEEILAGLAAVLPKNIFLYVAGVSNVATLGRRFILQGGTQRNLAVVKAEVDFIRSHYHGEGEPEILIHPHCGEAGAIGVAQEAKRLHQSARKTTFIGLDQLQAIRYTSLRDESTRCSFCANHCSRTFIDVNRGEANHDGTSRIVLATCERGESLNVSEARELNRALAATRAENPNFAQIAGAKAWLPPPANEQPAPPRRSSWLFHRGRKRAREFRSQIHIGIPRVLNLYAYAPLFLAYFEAIGVPRSNITFSPPTTQEMYKRAVGLAAIDPCFPSKVCIAHVYDLLETSRKRRVDVIFFPMLDVLTTFLTEHCGAHACPAGTATPEAVKAAFSRTRDWFQNSEIQYVNPILNLGDKDMFRFQIYECFRTMLGLSWEENARAVDAGFQSLAEFDLALRAHSRRVLDELEASGRIGLVMLGRPYHHDPGLNHGIPELLRDLGYPLFSQSFLPLDPDLLGRLFQDDLAAGTMQSPLDVTDVWKNAFSASTNHKLWAAKFAARHPNLIPVELSNFKCGHDAFISRVIEQIAESAGKPHFCFRDLDENKPLASIRIRVETIHYFIEQYRSRLERGGRAEPLQTGTALRPC